MTDVATAPTTRARRWPLVVVVALFALLYGWDLWEAIESLLVLPGDRRAFGLPVPWTALWAGVVLPVVVFFVAVMLGRGRATFARAAILTAGLCLVAVLSLGLAAYVRAGGL